MKTIKQLFILVLVITGLTACSTKSDVPEQMTNYVTLAATGETTMTDDNADGLEITVSLAYSLDHDAIVNLGLDGDDKGAVKLNTTQVSFKAGEKKATVKLLSNQSNLLVTQEVVYVKVTSASETNI